MSFSTHIYPIITIVTIVTIIAITSIHQKDIPLLLLSQNNKKTNI